MPALPTLNGNSKSTDFPCPCGACDGGKLDDAFMQQLLSFLANSGRGEWGVDSGKRCAPHNASVGGSEKSLHLYGRAIDLYTPTVQTKAVAIDAAHKTGLKGLGLGSNFTHIDNREIPATWTYPKKS